MLILSKKHTTPKERFRQPPHAESTEIRRVFRLFSRRNTQKGAIKSLCCSVLEI